MSAQPNIISSASDSEVLRPGNDNQWQIVRDRSAAGIGKYYGYDKNGAKELIGGFGVSNFPFANDTNAAANTVQLSIPGAPVLQDGYIFEARILTTNTGDTSLQINAQGLIQVTDTDGNALVGGELVNSEIYLFSYNSTTLKYELLGLSKPAPGLPYKVYVALLTQSGVAAPTAVVIENTLGFIPTLSYNGVGIYDIVSAGAFTIDKTVVFICQNAQGTSVPRVDSTFGDLVASWNTNPNVVKITSYNWAGTALIDDNMTNTTIEIRIYQ